MFMTTNLVHQSVKHVGVSHIKGSQTSDTLRYIFNLCGDTHNIYYMGVGHTLLLKSASNDDNKLSYSILLEILTPVFTRLKTKVLINGKAW